MAYFDKAVKYVTEFSVNLDVLYHVSFLSFVVFWIYKTHSEARNKFDRHILKILSLAFIVRICLNLLSINKDYEKYSRLVNNDAIDIFTWFVLVITLMIAVWEKYRT